jgi:uncharacterized repeat protein (TIGR03806 family)
MFVESLMPDQTRYQGRRSPLGTWPLGVGFALLFVLAGVPGLAQEAAADADKPYGIPERVKWTTSRVVGSPDPPRPYRMVRAFPQFVFKHPVFIAQDPLSERFMVAEYDGMVYSFDPSDLSGAKDLFLDMGRNVSAFSFHPEYERNGQVFVFSAHDPKIKDRSKSISRVSRFTLVGGSDPPRLDRDSEEIIVEWPGGGHNGGEAIIGPDGYLYITTGDGTGSSDRDNTGQGVNDLMAVMMRLDVENPDPGRKYSIPKDNPFVDMPDARGEIWAYGFRNPWRFSFDPVSGKPWVGDVGQDLWEYIELVSRGSNHGWSVMEGSHPFHPNKERGPTPIVPPVAEHHHTECRSITGGYVYEGDKFPELRDVYIYGDYQYGKVWGFRYDHEAGEKTWHEELADTTVKVSSFGLGRDGSFYALDYDRGEIYQLDRNPAPKQRQPFPRKLSETGLFISVEKHEVVPGVIPYSINAPFWSDGVGKERFFAVPGDLGIDFHEDTAWAFDDGSVTVKSFSIEAEQGRPETRRRIETRIVVKQENHWVGYSYVWNDEQTDAMLVDANGLDKTYKVKDASAPGGTREQRWHYPSRKECMFCHSRAAGFVLGLNTRQMNRPHDYGAVSDNQLRALNHIGLFKTPLEKPPEEYAAFPDPFNVRADLEERVKTYLNVNCAMCHVGSGGGNSNLNLGLKTPLAEGRMIDEIPLHGEMGASNARVVAPGDPHRSTLYKRVVVRGTNQMPPTSTNRVDERGAQLLFDWIKQLEAKPAAAGE